jgi:hypothetical protein
VFDTGLGTITGGVLSSASSSLLSQGTKSIGKEASREIAKNGGKMTNKAISLISRGRALTKTAKELEKIQKFYGTISDYYETR